MAKKDKYSKLAEDDHKNIENEKIRVRFSFLDWSNDSFFADGLSSDYYQNLFESLDQIKNFKEKEFVERHPDTDGLKIKPINWDYEYITETTFPISAIKDEEMKVSAKIRAFELRVKKNQGRIHGFIFSKTFYVVWIDPAHNLFPGKGKLPVEKKDYIQIKAVSPDAVNLLTDEREKLKSEILSLEKKLSETEQAFEDLIIDP